MNTQTPQALQARFTVRGVQFIQGRGGLTAIQIDADQARAEIYLHGAHVTAYQKKGSKPLLFLSGKSDFAPGKPIRGGVPIVFPWFGGKAGDSAAPAHGFARIPEWTLDRIATLTGGAIQVELSLSATPASKALWPHDCSLRYRVTIGSKLEMSLSVRNPAATPITFAEALHTYFVVADIRRATVTGLVGVSYSDRAGGGSARRVQEADPITFTAETDRLYTDTQATCIIDDPAGSRSITIAKRGSNSTVVWNPWIAKAKAMPDFGDDEWPGMLCVETANAGPNEITLGGGGEHEMTAQIEEANA